MDHQRFDAALRALESGTTRRRGLAAALAVILGGAGLDASAKGTGTGAGAGNDGRPSPAGPCGPRPRDNRCRTHRTCCTGYCVSRACRCKPNWMECAKGSQCCSGRCVDGRCDGGAKPAGAPCEENFNCQSGMACIRGVCTRSNRATCDAANCPGCCSGTTCRPGGTDDFCGAAGVACGRCARGMRCRNGTCKGGGGGGGGGTCSATTCAKGCCNGATCVTATDAAACGTGGAACAPCLTGESCVSGVCKVLPVWTNTTTIGSGPGTNPDQFKMPYGIALSGDDLTLFVSESTGSRVSIWTRPDADGTFAPSVTLGSIGAGDGQLYGPMGVDVTPDNMTLLVAESANHRISVWSRPGTASSDAWAFQTKFSAAPGGALAQPSGVTAVSNTLIYVADYGNNRIVIYQRSSSTATDWASVATVGAGNGTDAADDLKQPYATAVSSDDRMLAIADYGNNRVSVWTRPDTSSSWTHEVNFGEYGIGPGQFKDLSDVSISADKLTIRAVDGAASVVSIWTRPDAASTTWTFLQRFGAYGSGTGQFNTPVGLAVGGSDEDTIYVTDAFNNRVSVWTTS